MPAGPTDSPERLFHFAEPAGNAAPVARHEPQVVAAPETHVRHAAGAVPGEKILITGIAGGQGRLIARRLAGSFQVTGVDRTPWAGHPPGMSVHVLDLRKRKMEDIFRTEHPETVIHQGFIRHFRGDPRVRHEVNVLGTKRLLEYAIKYGAKRVIVISSGYVYGAGPTNPYYLDEDFSLNVSRNFPDVRDLAEVDSLVTAFLWRHPELQTTILRPVPTLGYYVHSAISRYLRQRWVPMIMGFDPMMQFIHEEDVAEAVALALACGTHGIYNVVGPGSVPMSVAIEETGGNAVSIPEPLARFVFQRLFNLGLYHTPPGAMDFLKYPCTLDGRRFHDATGFTPLFNLQDTFASVRH